MGNYFMFFPWITHFQFLGRVLFFFRLLCFNLVPDLHYLAVYNSRHTGRRLLGHALSL